MRFVNWGHGLGAKQLFAFILLAEDDSFTGRDTNGSEMVFTTCSIICVFGGV